MAIVQHSTLRLDIMARFFKILPLLILIIITIACQEGKEAGDLQGQWRITGSDSKYISFSGRVVVFRNLEKGEVFGNFQHVGDSLFIQCYSVEGVPSDTASIEKDFGFKPFTNIRVKIESLDTDNLILSKDRIIWSLYKY